MESGDHHVRSTGFDAQNQENMFDLSDDSGQHASAMLSYLHMIFKKESIQ